MAKDIFHSLSSEHIVCFSIFALCLGKEKRCTFAYLVMKSIMMSSRLHGVIVFCLLAVRVLAKADNVYYVSLLDGTVEAYPEKYVSTAPTVDAEGMLTIQLVQGERTWPKGSYTGWSQTCPPLPELISYKFNNKFNPSLHTDVEATAIDKDVYLTLNAIGKRLTPSFQLSDRNGVAYVDGVLQESKVSRLRFDHDITYLVTYPGYTQLTMDDESGTFVQKPFGREYTIHTTWLTDDANKVPRIDIYTDNGEIILSKENYLHALFRLSGNGVYDDMEEDVWIKGRGNSSWAWPKKPYRLKFDKKVKPFGLTKGKSWVLLSNYQTGSMFANAIAMKIGQMTGAACTNHIVPVELYINGAYAGSYQFTEKVGIAGNSVDIDEEKGCLLELDTYYAPYCVRSARYGLPVNLKNPDLGELYGDDQNAIKKHLYLIEDEFNRMEEAIYYDDTDVEDYLDVDACARFLLANDLVRNQEINHPKSTFAYKEDLNAADSKLVFGPLWDFDWAFGYEQNWTYCRDNPTGKTIAHFSGDGGSYFFNDLMTLSIVQRYYYKVWSEFIQNDCVAELSEFVQDYFNFARVSFEHNDQRWGDGAQYGSDIAPTQNWLRQRADYLYGKLTPYNPDDFDQNLDGDVDGDQIITVTDASQVFSYVMGKMPDGFAVNKADMNADGRINITDVVLVVRKMLDARAQYSRHRFHTPVAEMSLRTEPFEIALNEQVDVPVALVRDSDSTEGCRALQVDVSLPDGLTLLSVRPVDELSGWSLSSAAVDERTTRVALVPSRADVLMPETSLFVLGVRANGVTASGDGTISFTGGHVTNDEHEDRRLRGSSVSFMQTTGFETIDRGSLRVEGGSRILITSLDEREVEIIGADGRLLRTVHVTPGVNEVAMPAGIYLVGGHKVAVYGVQ